MIRTLEATIDEHGTVRLLEAVELPAAIAFLDFLRERGVAELGRVRSMPPKRAA